MFIITIELKAFFKRESRETVIAAKILKKLIINEKSVTKKEIFFLKHQSVNIGKAIGLIGLQFIPGSSVGIIALERIAKKRGLTIFPKENKFSESKKTNL
jgi:hypothetical protein